MQNITEAFKGKTLVITGGTGSFGSTVLKHFLTSDIEEIQSISRDGKTSGYLRVVKGKEGGSGFDSLKRHKTHTLR